MGQAFLHGNGGASPLNFKVVDSTRESAVASGKNLLNNTAKSKTENGVTFTVNADGSVTVNGTATDQAILVLNENVLEKGQYLVSAGATVCNFMIATTKANGDKTYTDAPLKA